MAETDQPGSPARATNGGAKDDSLTTGGADFHRQSSAPQDGRRTTRDATLHADPRAVSEGSQLRKPQCAAFAVRQQTQPEINISVNVNARNLAPNDFEVEIHLDAKAMSADKVMFAAEIKYAGVFRMENFPQNPAPSGRADRMPAPALSLRAAESSPTPPAMADFRR